MAKKAGGGGLAATLAVAKAFSKTPAGKKLSRESLKKVRNVYKKLTQPTATSIAKQTATKSSVDSAVGVATGSVLTAAAMSNSTDNQSAGPIDKKMKKEK